MRRADIGSSQHCPAAVIPERGQITEHSSESPSNEGWAVLHERETGSNFANDPGHFRPQSAALAVDTDALSGNTDVLAGKSARNHVNTASPRSSVKSSNVIPDRERREPSIILPGEQNACGIGVELDGADGSPPEQLAAKDPAAATGEQGELA